MLEAERTWTVDASVDAVYAVIADVERYPDWHPFFATVDVLERDHEKRAVRATCTHPTPVATLTTEITFTYDPQAEVEARGVTFAGDTFDTGVCHMAFFADPDGNALMLHHRYAPRIPEE